MCSRIKRTLRRTTHCANLLCDLRDFSIFLVPLRQSNPATRAFFTEPFSGANIPNRARLGVQIQGCPVPGPCPLDLSPSTYPRALSPGPVPCPLDPPCFPLSPGPVPIPWDCPYAVPGSLIADPSIPPHGLLNLPSDRDRRAGRVEKRSGRQRNKGDRRMRTLISQAKTDQKA